MTAVDERAIYAKLEAMKDIRYVIHSMYTMQIYTILIFLLIFFGPLK